MSYAPPKSHIKNLLSGICIALIAAGCSKSSQPGSETPPQSNKSPSSNQPASDKGKPSPLVESKPVPPPSEVPVAGPPKESSTVSPASSDNVETVGAKIEKKAKDFGFEIIVGQDVTEDQATRALDLLDKTIDGINQVQAHAKVNEKSPRMEPLFDTLILDLKNESAVERDEKVQTRFNVNQPLNRAIGALRFQYARCEGEESGAPGSVERLQNCKKHPRTDAIRKFREARVELADVRSQVSEFKIQCDTSVVNCVIGAKNVKAAAPFVNVRLMKLVRIFRITGRSLTHIFIPVTYDLIGDRELSVSVGFATYPKVIANDMNDISGNLQ